MPEGRVKLYLLRRLMKDGSYRYLEFDPVGYSWVKDRIDATSMTKERAYELLRQAREANSDDDVVCHRVVPCR